MDIMNWSGLRLERSNGEALYLQLASALADAITCGEIGAAERLPSERELAARLGLSRTTAVNAYRELEARGLVRGYVGRGTFVCAGIEREGAPFAWRGKVALGAQRTVDPSMRTFSRYATDPRMISFAAGAPALDLFPIDAWEAATNRVLASAGHLAHAFGPTEGMPVLRTRIATRFGVAPGETLIVSGAQQGLDLIARCLLDPGDVVVMDRPGYLGAIQVFRSAGVHVIGWDIVRADPDELEDLVLRYRPKLLYTNPTFNNPTSRTLTLPERRDLLEVARRYRLPVIEDQTYREMWFSTPPPKTLLELDRQEGDGGIVIQVNTFSKVLAGGLRLGFVLADEAIVDQLALVKQRTDVSSATLVQLVVADLLASRDFDTHLERLRVEHLRRRNCLLDAVHSIQLRGSLVPSPTEGGIYLWCRLGQGIDARYLAQVAATSGVGIVNGDLFYPDAGDRSGADEVRLCFAAVHPDRMGEGMRRLEQAIGLARSNAGAFTSAGTIA